ncbi:hypothetical protein F0562_018459 [Nyssa sinensis]|uniref:Uncharacterized protein n=1 Tax=Nyssa sinensis TaxID=561372 RepID=A0A5J4ZDF9_9ASTE|nr:hypothetical protein F0562_018459 [Nyssa sinensis]
MKLPASKTKVAPHRIHPSSRKTTITAPCTTTTAIVMVLFCQMHKSIIAKEISWSSSTGFSQLLPHPFNTFSPSYIGRHHRKIKSRCKPYSSLPSIIKHLLHLCQLLR